MVTNEKLMLKRIGPESLVSCHFDHSWITPLFASRINPIHKSSKISSTAMQHHIWYYPQGGAEPNTATSFRVTLLCIKSRLVESARIDAVHIMQTHLSRACKTIVRHSPRRVASPHNHLLASCRSSQDLRDLVVASTSVRDLGWTFGGYQRLASSGLNPWRIGNRREQPTNEQSLLRIWPIIKSISTKQANNRSFMNLQSYINRFVGWAKQSVHRFAFVWIFLQRNVEMSWGATLFRL